MKYNFLEENLGSNFCKEGVQSVKNLIDNSVDFTLVALPGVGATTFFKYLATTNMANFIYLNLTHLPLINKTECMKALLRELGGYPTRLNQEEVINMCEEKIKILSKSEKKTVILFNHFYCLDKDLSTEFFAVLSKLRTTDPEKIVMVFHAYKPLIELLPEKVVRIHMSVLRKAVYVPPYSQADLNKIIDIIAFDRSRDNTFIQKALMLSGGHCLLLRLLLKSNSLDNLLEDRYIITCLKEIYQHLNVQDKKVIARIALGKDIKEVNSHLLDIGLVQKTGDEYRLFSPLFAEFVISNTHLKFSIYEAKLFKLLMKNLGKVVSKDEIFHTVWGEYNATSDWALNSIVYRIRKNPIFIKRGFHIESQKKIGYALVKS